MSGTSVLLLLLTVTSVLAYSSFPRTRRVRALPSSSSLAEIQSNDNEIESLLDEVPNIIRTKKSTKNDKLTLDDLKKSDIEEEINNNNKVDDQSNKNIEERSPIKLLQEIHQVDKNETDEDGDVDRIRRHYMMMPNGLASGAGDTMLVMPVPSGLQSGRSNTLNLVPRTGWAQHGIGISTPTIQASSAIEAHPSIHATKYTQVATPSTYASLAIPTKQVITSHIPLQQSYYYSSIPSHSHSSYSCLCPCSQHGYPQTYSNYDGHSFGGYKYPFGLKDSVLDGRSISNFDEDILQTPYIFQGPRMNFPLAKASEPHQSVDGHKHSPDCSMDVLSSFNLDKDLMENLTNNEEKKLKKIEDCAKNKDINPIEHSMLVHMVNAELDLLKNEVKNMQRSQNLQQSQSPQQHMKT